LLRPDARLSYSCGSFAIDQVFSFFPNDPAAFAIALNNLTIRFGRNPNAFSTYGSGGCFDFDRLDNYTNRNVLDLRYSRIVNNTAQIGATGLSVYWGTAKAENNWWGCSSGPNTVRCDTAKIDRGLGGSGGGTVDFSPWLRVVTTATPSTLLMNETSSVLASVNFGRGGIEPASWCGALRAPRRHARTPSPRRGEGVGEGQKENIRPKQNESEVFGTKRSTSDNV
jgi:hypothetical protein